MFRKSQKTRGAGEKIFQYKDGKYLPDSSQHLPIDPSKYSPHESTRYMNIVLSKNGEPIKEGNDLPKLYDKRENCCGCTACYSICPMSNTDRPEVARKYDTEGNPLKIEFLFGYSGTKETYEHTGAITMLPDEEGFLYPVVDAEICIHCNMCLTVCAFKEAQKGKGYL